MIGTILVDKFEEVLMFFSQIYENEVPSEPHTLGSIGLDIVGSSIEVERPIYPEVLKFRKLGREGDQNLGVGGTVGYL
jgi:hypothetical protein